MVRTHPNGLVGAQRGMAERPDMSGFLPEITVRTYVVSGSEDQIIPPSVSKQMQVAIPRAEWVEIAGAGHVPMMEAPEATVDALNRLVTEVQTS
jgi:pimeloyl-ACP methyl ester carboxylesterase